MSAASAAKIVQPGWFSQHDHKARKPHACHFCLGVIVAGSVYTQTSWDGRDGIRSVRAHTDCQALVTAVKYPDGGAGIPPFAEMGLAKFTHEQRRQMASLLARAGQI